MQKSSKSWVKIKDSLERSLARHLEGVKNAFESEFEEKWARNCHFYQRVWKVWKCETHSAFCFEIIFRLTRFLKILQNNTQKCSFSRFSEELTLIFTSFCCGFSADPIFICAKLFCFFERNIWTSHSRNLWKFDWKLKLTRKIGKCIFFYFLTGNFNCNDSEWNNVNNVATNAQNWELEQKVWSCRD